MSFNSIESDPIETNPYDLNDMKKIRGYSQQEKDVFPINPEDFNPYDLTHVTTLTLWFSKGKKKRSSLNLSDSNPYDLNDRPF
ncbi:MAG: hypothetical protein ACOX0P_02260 [Candidatus Dojkabacteria bacterium]|jgi:hypothetical protein